MLGVVAPAVEQQRRGAGAVRAALHFADEDHVVAFLVAAAVEAFEGGRRAMQQRRAAGAFVEGHAGPAVGALGAKRSASVLLVGRQHVDGVVRAGAEHRHRGGGARQAPQHQRRVERDRVEGVGGEADHLRRPARAPVTMVTPGGEHAQRGAKLLRGEGRRLGLAGRRHGGGLHEFSCIMARTGLTRHAAGNHRARVAGRLRGGARTLRRCSAGDTVAVLSRKPEPAGAAGTGAAGRGPARRAGVQPGAAQRLQPGCRWPAPPAPRRCCAGSRPWSRPWPAARWWWTARSKA